jgi:serine protease AprX
LSAAVEALWFKGIFVTVAAGNDGLTGGSVSYPPANDPFVLTVGAIDDKSTADVSDDSVAAFTSRGVTQDGFTKPEVFAPGVNIVSVTDPNSILFNTYPDKVVAADDFYLRLSGTSMATAVASGAAALVFQAHPAWTPGDVKCTLASFFRTVDGYRVFDVGAAVGATVPSCNSDFNIAQSAGFGRLMKVAAVAYVADHLVPSLAMTEIGLSPPGAIKSNGPLLTLDAIKWDAVNWSAIKWDAIKWGAIKWDAIKWGAIKWDAIKWAEITNDGVDFQAIKWSAIKWDAIKWDAIKWAAIKWSSVEFDAIKWSAVKWAYEAN